MESQIPQPEFVRVIDVSHFYFYFLVAVSIFAARLGYDIFFSSLAKIPGQWLSKFSSLPLYRITHLGHEATALAAQHSVHGSIVRISPREVSISDGRTLQKIYVQKGGFLKPEYYRNFDVDGHATIFSETNPEKRALRAKAVASIFSLSSIRRDGSEVLRAVVEQWVDGLEKAKEISLAANKASPERRVNVLKGTRSLALDAVTGYLMGRSYGALKETLQPGQMSAAAFVDEYVSVGRFFYLPTWLFSWVEWVSYKLNRDKGTVERSMKFVDDFVYGVVQDVDLDDEKDMSYQTRLLRAGINTHETKAQLKDLMFAGTDSTGMNLATICWYLAKYPEKHEKLREELIANPDADPQTLPYLSGVVKEGLRLSMANPTRLPRVVPSTGFTMPSGKYIPPGMIVGISPHSMHFNPEIFPSPMAFMPERWANPTEEMLRDYMPFGLGSRACIARNLATVELYVSLDCLVRRNVLQGAVCVAEEIEIIEWFNSRVKGEKIELMWIK